MRYFAPAFQVIISVVSPIIRAFSYEKVERAVDDRAIAEVEESCENDAMLTWSRWKSVIPRALEGQTMRSQDVNDARFL